MVLDICIERDYYAYITSDNEKLFELVKKSYTRKDRTYNNYYRMYDTVTKLFYTLVNNGSVVKVKAGTIPFLTASLDLKGIEYNLVDKRKKLDKELPVVPQLSDKVTLREYQVAAVKQVFNNPFSCVQLPTGTGKSEVSASIIKSFLSVYPNEAFLYLVPTVALQKEAVDRFKNYGISCNTKFPIQTSHVNVLTYKAVLAASTEKFDYKQRDSIGALITDEAHHLSAPKLSKQVHRLHNLRLNVGVSATLSADLEQKEYLKELNVKEFDVFGCTGKVVYRMDINQSIENNFVTKIEVRVLTNTPRHVLNDENDWQLIKNTVLKDTERAQRVADYTKHIVDEANLNTVVLLIPEIEWSDIYMSKVYNNFKDTDIRVFELFGGNVIKEYKQGKLVTLTDEEKIDADRAIRDPKIRTVFSCTSFFFEGINITGIQAIINCYGGRDSKRVKQQCGRAMRLFKGKDVAYIHEIKDLHNPVLESQFRRRISIYEKEYNAKIIYSTF
nr:hypothetical protein DGKKSRWO_DGKKSRWO_CDS_0096 [uncultured phage]CAI9752273.1 hypothetical protein CVNMHQAP_CVNMHQAP_CDS_0096 [uncultured phage]